MKTCCMILLAAFTSLASAQQNDVTSILEVLDVTNGRRTVVKEFPYRVEAPNCIVGKISFLGSSSKVP